jgi:hypothetical protein
MTNSAEQKSIPPDLNDIQVKEKDTPPQEP